MTVKFLDVHLIQSFPASNLNRGEDGTPKSVFFGGAPRNRISSQAWKNAIRHDPNFWQEAKRVIGAAPEAGIRTKWLADRLLLPRLVEKGKSPDEARAVARLVAGHFSAKSGKMEKVDGEETGKTPALLYLSPDEMHGLVNLCLEKWEVLLGETDAKKTPAEIKKYINDLIKKSAGRTNALDMALYGRMLADQTELSLDGAVLMAHSFSVNSAATQTDFYTAVDDLAGGGEAVSGMLGVTPFVASCHYRFASVDVSQLHGNLAGDDLLAKAAIAGFLQAMVVALPTGKKTSFATYTLPSFVMVVLQENRPCSMANAFDKPVKAAGNGYIEPSIQVLEENWQGYLSSYGSDGVAGVFTMTTPPTLSLQHLEHTRVANLESLRNQVLDNLSF